MILQAPPCNLKLAQVDPARVFDHDTFVAQTAAQAGFPDRRFDTWQRKSKTATGWVLEWTFFIGDSRTSVHNAYVRSLVEGIVYDCTAQSVSPEEIACAIKACATVAI